MSNPSQSEDEQHCMTKYVPKDSETENIAAPLSVQASAPASEPMDVANTSSSPDDTPLVPSAPATAPSTEKAGEADPLSSRAEVPTARSPTSKCTPPARTAPAAGGEDMEVESAHSHHSPDEGGCWVCHRNDEQQLILLCDGCEGEYHTFCHSPQLEGVPGGDWFCNDCVASGRDVEAREAKRIKE
ncbi:unnamed protein product, partial [Sphacelaria rigidula]